MGHPMTALVKMGLDQAFMAPAGMALVSAGKGLHACRVQVPGLAAAPPSQLGGGRLDCLTANTAAPSLCGNRAQFYVAISLMEGKGISTALDVVHDKFLPTMVANYAVRRRR